MRLSRLGLGVTIAAAMMTAVGCDSVSAIEDDGEVEFVLVGSIDSDFSGVAPRFDGVARFSRTGIANRLDIVLKVADSSGDREERADIAFRFAYASNSGELPPGHYTVVPDELVSSVGEGSYESIRGTAEHAMYGFRGTSLELDVDESARGRIAARFAFEMEQTRGERLVDGQRVVVELAGPVTARGSFDLLIEGLELPGGE